MEQLPGVREVQDRHIPEYRLIFSRRRTVSIIVSPDKGVTVRAPYGTSLRSVERFVKKKESWIRKHLKKHSEVNRINHGKEYFDGEEHLFMGKEYTLNITKSQDPYVRHSGNMIEIGLNDPGNRYMIKALIDRWYILKGQESFSGKFEEIINRNLPYGFLPSGFTVKPLKSRWGSCSTRGSITISSELIKLEPRFADYVIIHELCHLKHHNHSTDFYRLLGQLVPDYKEIRKELRKYLTR